MNNSFIIVSNYGFITLKEEETVGSVIEEERFMFLKN